MASYVFTLIFVNSYYDKISSIFILDIISGENIFSKFKRLQRLINNSSIQFAFYKLLRLNFYVHIKAV